MNFLHTIPDVELSRDEVFDDHKKMRSAGIRGDYKSHYSTIPALKPGIIFELGFDQTAPNDLCDISSWAIDKLQALDIPVIDNRAKQVKCYRPEYTLVEKLQAVSTKYRLQQKRKFMPVNFLRHYYDIYQLLNQNRVVSFLGTKEYQKHKEKRFRANDEIDIQKNEAFLLSDKTTRATYAQEYEKKSAIYFGAQPSFDEILDRIKEFIDRL